MGMLTVAIAAATMITLRDVLILAPPLPNLGTKRFSSPQSLPGCDHRTLGWIKTRPGRAERMDKSESVDPIQLPLIPTIARERVERRTSYLLCHSPTLLR